MTTKSVTIANGKTETILGTQVTVHNVGEIIAGVWITVVLSTGKKFSAVYMNYGGEQTFSDGSTKVGITVSDPWIGSITSAKVTVNDNIAPTPTNIYAINFTSTPPGATVYIDGTKRLEKTPTLKSDLTIGRHLIKMELTGYPTYEAYVDVTSAHTKTKPFQLYHEFSTYGTLYVTSTPTGATIAIDGVVQPGSTPKTFPNVVPKTYKITLTKTGYNVYEQNIAVTKNFTSTVSATLVSSATGTLYFSGANTGVKIDIVSNGKTIGSETVSTPKTYPKVPVGTYTITMSKTGYTTYSQTLTISASKTTTVSKVLALANAQTTLTIAPSVSTITEGTMMKFTGQLKDAAGKGVPNAKILFWKDTTIDFQLKNSGTAISATTDAYGNYAVNWYADNTNLTTTTTHYFYATFAGITNSYASCKSSTCKVTISPAKAADTKITLTASPSTIVAGNSIKFTGNVLNASTNVPAAGAIVTFWWKRLIGNVQLTNNGTAISATTSSTGLYSASWYAQDLDNSSSSDNHEIVAVVSKMPAYNSSTSNTINVTISPGVGNITCTTTPSGATVLIDSKLQTGTTPRTYTGLTVGSHSIQFKLSGYADYDIASVKIPSAGATATATATLVKGITESVLTLNSPGSSYVIGDLIPLAGTLKNTNGAALYNGTITFWKKNTSLIPDEQLKVNGVALTATTNTAGGFVTTWKAADINTTSSTTYTIYAKYAGTSLFAPAVSRTYDITIKVKEAPATTLTLITSTSAAKVGAPIVLSGILKTIEGTVIPNATITFYDDQYIIDSELKNGSTIVKATTNAYGVYQTTWTAALLETLTGTDTIKVVAKYAGSIDYKECVAPSKEVVVTKDKVTPTLSLSASPTTVEIGKPVTISGYLQDPSTNAGIANATIRLYDVDDILGLTNDTIANVTTNSSGYYTYTWTAAEEIVITTTSIVEIQAQYDGNTEYNKITSTTKNVTVTPGAGLLRNFRSVPAGATVEVDGKQITPVGTTVNETPFSAYVTTGQHVAKFYFTQANMPTDGTYAPMSIPFTVTAGSTDTTITAEWEAESICSLLGTFLGFSMSAEECKSNTLVKVADFFLDISSFTRILFGKDIYGKESAPTKWDSMAVLFTVFPFGKATKIIKGLKGIKVDEFGALIAAAIGKSERLAEVLNTSLFFNRLSSMSTSDLDKIEDMIVDILKNGEDEVSLTKLQLFIEEFQFKAMDGTKLAAAQAELASLFDDAAVKRSVDFLKRADPNSPIGKEFVTIFTNLLEKGSMPEPEDLLRLAKAGEENPQVIIDFAHSYGFRYIYYAAHKMEYMGGVNPHAAKMMEDWVKTIIQHYNDKTFSHSGAIQNICKEFADNFTEYAASYSDEVIAAVMKKLPLEYENAIYNISQEAGTEYVAMMKRVMAQYGTTAPAKAAADTIEGAVDISMAWLRTHPTKGTTLAKMEAVYSKAVQDATALGMKTDTYLLMQKTKGGQKAIDVIKHSHEEYSAAGVEHIQRVYTAAGSVPKAEYTTVRNVVDPLLTTATNEIYTAGNKGISMGKYTALDGPNNVKKVADKMESVSNSMRTGAKVREFVDDVALEMKTGANTLRTSGITVADQTAYNKLTSLTKYILGGVDEVAETAAEKAAREAEEIARLGNDLERIADEVENVVERLEPTIGFTHDAAIKLIEDIVYDMPSIALSNGKALSTAVGFTPLKLITKFKNYLDNFTLTNITSTTIANFRIQLASDMATSWDTLIKNGVYITKEELALIPSDLKRLLGITDNIASKFDEMETAYLKGLSDAAKVEAAAAAKAAKAAIKKEAEATQKFVGTELDEIIERISKEVPDSAEAVSSRIASKLNTLTDAKSAECYIEYNKLLHTLGDTDLVKMSNGQSLMSFSQFSEFNVLLKLESKLSGIADNALTGTVMKKLVDDVLYELRDIVEELASRNITVEDVPTNVNPILQWITGQTDEMLDEVLELTEEFFTKYTTFFGKLLKGEVTMLSKSTVDDFLEESITNPSEVMKLVDTMDITKLCDKLKNYGVYGKFLADYIKTLDGIRVYRSRLGSNYLPMIAATAKAAAKMLSSGDTHAMQKIWATLFEGANYLKTLDDITKSNSYTDLYYTVNEMSKYNPKSWPAFALRMWNNRGKKIATTHKSGLITGNLGKGSLLITFILFGLDSWYFLTSYATGTNPTQVVGEIKSKTIAINTSINTLQDECTFTKSSVFDAELETYRKQIDSLIEYSEAHKDGIKKMSGIAGWVQDYITDDEGIYTSTQLTIENAETQYLKFLECQKETGTGTTTTDDIESLWWGIKTKSEQLTGIYFLGKNACSAGNTELAKSREIDHATVLNTLISDIQTNLQALINANHGQDANAMLTLHNGELQELQGCTTGPIEETTIKGTANSFIYGLGPLYESCNSYCENGSSKLEDEMKEFQNMIDEAKELLEENKDALATMGLAIQLSNAITIAEGRYDMLLTCGTTASPVSSDLLTIIRNLQESLKSSYWGCKTFFDANSITALSGLLPTYADQIVQLQTIRTDRAREVEELGLTKELEDNYNYYNSFYEYYSGQSSSGVPTDELPATAPLYEQIDALISDLTTFYWNCYKAKKRGDTANFNTNLDIYKGLIADLKGLQNSKSAEIADIGYTSEVTKRIAEHESNLADLTATSSSSNSDNPSTPTTPTTPDDSDSSGGSYVNESYNKAVALIDKIDDNSNACWELCKAGSKAALTAALKTYVSNHNALKKLYAEHLPELTAASANTWVKGDIDYHTSDLAKLTNCASSSTPEDPVEDPVEEPDTTDMTDEEVIDTVDQYLDEMEDLWQEGQNATNSTGGV